MLRTETRTGLSNGILTDGESTYIAVNGVGYFLCKCCQHCTDRPLHPGEPVICRDCGKRCSCEGCVAEQEDR